MPGINKRRSAGDDQDDEHGEASTSTHRQAQFKRLRTNGNNRQISRRGAEDDEEEGEEEEEVNGDDESMGEQEVEKVDELDGDEDELADESTQGAAVNATGEAEIGVIEKINLTNFMCHDRLEVNLGPKLNFIIGNNGSGKSAILTAITIALGGKATATSRGNSLKSFVKEGKQTAIVEVTLRNTGEEAFKPQQYKNKIVIERTIRADGSGSWKIKSGDKRIISTKREELNAICDHANIQVDNPMNILTQDSARQFLSQSHSDEKYEFFLKGTQLQQLSAEYDLIALNSSKIRNAISSKEEGLPLLRQKAQEANQLLEVVQKAADMKKHVGELRQRLVWASVEEKETEFEALAERSERQKLKMRKIDEKLVETRELEEKHEVTITELEKRISESSERDAPLHAETKELKEREKVHIAEIKKCKLEESALNEQYKRIKAQLKDVNKRIEAENRKDGNEGKRKALTDQRKRAEDERRELEQEQVACRDQISVLDGKIAEIERRASELQGKQDSLRNAVGSAEGMMQQLRVTQQSRLTAYGHKIPDLLRAIDREPRWNQKPVGPIGNHLKLRDNRWAGVLESVMGNTLNAFCVTNIQDRNLLQKLKLSTNCTEISILTGSDELFDYSHGEPEGDVLTILRVLEIESPFLTRQLINSLHIEQCALVTARAEGDALMRQGRRNVKSCFSMDMYRLQGGKVGSSTISLQQHRGAPRLTTDIQARLNELQEQHRQDNAALQVVSLSLRNEIDQKRDLNEERAQLRQKIPTLQRRARERHAEMERLDEELREDEPINIGALVEARKEFEVEIESITDKVQKIQDLIDAEERKLEPLSTEKLRIREQLAKVQEMTQSLRPELERAARKRLEAHNEIIHREKEKIALEPKIEELESSVARCEKELEEKTAAAQGYCERVPALKSVKSLERQIEVAEQQLQEAAKRHGVSIEAITAQVKQYYDAFTKAQGEIGALREVLNELNTALNIRKDKWRLFRRIIAVRAKNNFSHHLSKRGFSGTLAFDHEKRKLGLTVKTEEATGGHQDKDPKSLSGGEKSFATICLLLALWESIGCPIRCLDEFDVFMDAVNRKISMQMMVDAAKGPNGIQYVLITPLGMGGTKIDDRDCKAIMLTEPERNQTTLPFNVV